MSLILGAILLVISVLVGGGLVVFLENMNRGKLIKILLSLSGGFLLAIAFIHFIPEIYAHGSSGVGYYILLGFLIQLFLEYFSGGIEHGHIHAKDVKGTIPWSLFLALSFHSFFEGMPLEAQFMVESGEAVAESVHHLHHHAHHDHSKGDGVQGLLLGIILHKIPVAIALMTLLLASGFKKSKAWMVLSAFALMAPLGMLVGHYGAKNAWLNLEIILAVVVGMFLHISTTIIFESSENHKFNLIKLISLLLGVGLAMIAI
ncbi:ZIP family metal transporter [Brumimicrobium aurantiacum]|uniref:ZIP family metal transporter n=1 Tax=Brumimicrobium aurantiacum TaxID=1737063 RepID=A0A3E1EYL9_9FLAO|nr:ZIP family metal transporter [Brumimicrobium aurantiacum]RFC54655.1 ZIP family metal transporter [Brumimicrobium aurantiacum]